MLGVQPGQQQDDPIAFSEKISEATRSKTTDHFMVIARIESLMLGSGMHDALTRAETYLQAGADGIMIHSKRKDASEILEFASEYRKWQTDRPLVVVPTTFNREYEETLINAGANIIIYANHLLRASYPAMLKVATEILENGRSYECEGKLMPLSEILHFVPGVTKRD